MFLKVFTPLTTNTNYVHFYMTADKTILWCFSWVCFLFRFVFLHIFPVFQEAAVSFVFPLEQKSVIRLLEPGLSCLPPDYSLKCPLLQWG